MWVAACGSSEVVAAARRHPRRRRLSGGEGGSAGVDAPDALGAYAVGHTIFTAVDAARDDRELPVDVWYPVDAADAATEPRTEYPLGRWLHTPLGSGRR